MEKEIFIHTLWMLLIAGPQFAQVVSQDSIQALNDRDKALEASKSINDKKLKLAEKQKKLAEKTAEFQEKNQKAENSVEANRQAAAALSTNAQDKKLASNANSAAKDAQRDARNARKASEDVEELNKEIADLQKEIQEEEQKSGVASTATPNANPTQVVVPQTAGTTNYSNNNASVSQSGQVPPAPTIIQRNISADSLGGASNPNEIAQRVVESTYRNYPQQQGQPSIIINNIIVPSDYNRQAPANKTNAEPGSYEDYQAWLRYRNEQRELPQHANARRYERDERDERIEKDERIEREELKEERDRLTFKERFGEKPQRNSGLWVIPVVGVHASNFNANLQDGKYNGRTGWNAGLDFRARVRKFFVQPGIHYFSSSMEVTQEDSVSQAPLLTGPRIHSLKAPLMLGVYLTKAKGGFLRFNLKGGIVGNYVLSVDKSDIDRFEKDNIEDFSYGLNAGFGLELGFITFDFSHEWGMSPLFRDTNQKNNILRGTIGFKL
jgi:hypothetical protein